MYEEFFRLKARPFATTPDPDFLYWTETHLLAYTMLRYGLISHASITVIVGEIGSGKTTLLRQLMRDVPETIDLGLVSNMQAGRGQLLEWVLSALGEPCGQQSSVEMFRRFEALLIERYAAGRRVVLVFDEAQNLDVATLEELRMLSNINSEKDELLQIVLVGQPQLRTLLANPDLRQFVQRIAADFNLEPLSTADISKYVNHRLDVVGASWRIFDNTTFPLIEKATRGVPRLINILCDLCLVYGYAAEQRVIGADLVTEFLDGARQRGIYRQFASIADMPLPLEPAG